MNIITLNIWGGRVAEDFQKFISKQAQITDIFCLQEVYKDATKPFSTTPYADIAKIESFSVLEKLLPEHNLIFHPSLLDAYGVCMAIKKSLPVLDSGEVFIHKQYGYMPTDPIMGKHARNLQYAVIKADEGSDPITIINVHGLWNGEGKTDSEDRIDQSQKIIDLVSSLKTEVVLCGDFNLNPDTQSISMIEQAGLINLIKHYQIQSTRTSLYAKAGKFADYVFISKKLKVKSFSVMPDEVSDHAPLLLEI